MGLLGTYRTKVHVILRRSKMRIEVWVGILLIVASIGAKGDGAAVGDLDEAKMDLKKTMADQKRRKRRIDIMDLDGIITAMQAKISALEQSQATVKSQVSTLEEGQATVKSQVSSLKKEKRMRCKSGELMFLKDDPVEKKIDFSIHYQSSLVSSTKFSAEPAFMVAMRGFHELPYQISMKPDYVRIRSDSLSATSVIVY